MSVSCNTNKPIPLVFANLIRKVKPGFSPTVSHQPVIENFFKRELYYIVENKVVLSLNYSYTERVNLVGYTLSK